MRADFSFLADDVAELIQKQHVDFGDGVDLLQPLAAADEFRNGEQPVVPALADIIVKFRNGISVELRTI